MALELVAGALLSAALDKLFQSLVSPELVHFISGKKSSDDDDQLKNLKVKLRKARVLLIDAEQRQLEEEAVREWLDDLKHVIYRAQDMVDNINYDLLSNNLRTSHDSIIKAGFLKKIRSKIVSSCSYDSIIKAGFLKKIRSKIVSSCSHDSIIKAGFLKKIRSKIVSSYSRTDKTHRKGEMRKILKDLSLLIENEVGRDLKVFDDISTSGSSYKRRVAPWPEKSQIHGRDGDREKIMKLLMSNEDNVWGGKIGVIPIVGMGGIGKTTLAQLIYDDGRLEEDGFQHKAWVTVSTDFDVFRIIRIILQQVNSSGRHESDEPAMLQRTLNEALKDKKFLVVLDDVWDEDYHNWIVLKRAFEFGNCGSRIVVTTRSKIVATNVKTGPVYDLKEVSDEDCWKIFAEHAFDGGLSNKDEHLEEMSKRLVDKCGGIPLALTSLGGLLRSENDPKQWERILNNQVWKTDKILPSLWLSYYYLPSSLKQCFTYCSVFPKNYEFEKREMILLWMAEGFLHSDQQEKKMEEIGEDYFNNLVSRSLFQFKRSMVSFEDKFVVHDLLHDLAVFISREFCSSIDDNKKLELLPSKIRHLSFKQASYHCNYHESLKTCLCKAKHLRTFIGQGNLRSSYDGLVKNLLASQTHFRVFSSPISSFPNSISNLRHVRYLNLTNSDITEIPCSICTMYNLQTLILSYCRGLTRLPKDIARLVDLRHLETTRSGLVQMPPQMGNLKQLQTLTDFILSENGDSSSINELGKLQQLSGHLRISGLQVVKNVGDILKANLSGKKNITHLCLEWKCDTTTGREQYENVLKGLQPHPNLKELTIKDYSGLNFPTWVGGSQYSKIVSITLRSNKTCLSLPPLGQLPSLKILILKGFDELKNMGAEVYCGKNSSGDTPFRCLERLSIEDMPKLKEWLYIGDENEGECFPHLKHLRLAHCPNIIGCLLPKGHKIESLFISDSYKKVESLPLNHYPNLEKLTLTDCDSIKWLPSDYFPNLKELLLIKCDNFESLAFPQFLSNLERLTIEKCNEVMARHEEWDLKELTSLKTLVIKDCDAVLNSFPEGLLPGSLTSLELDSLVRLQSLNENTFENLTSLQNLRIGKCYELQNIPERVLRPPSPLCSLRIRCCHVLEKRYRKEKGEDWDKICHIPLLSIYGFTTCLFEWKENNYFPLRNRELS